MKIGYFNTAFPYRNPTTGKIIGDYAYGGAENVTYNLAVQMVKGGHHVFIFTSSLDSKESIEKYENIAIYRYKKNFTIGSAPISIDILYKPRRLGIDLDIVHAHVGSPPASIAAYWYARKEKKTFVVTYHGDVVWNWGGFIRRMGQYFNYNYLLGKILSYADVIISPSEYYIDESKILGKYRDKIVVIPNGVNIDEFDIGYSKEECRDKLDLSIDGKIILYLSWLVLPKGPDVLLNALPKIIERVSDAKLVFVGAGGMREKLVRLCKKKGVENNVKFAGFIEEDLKPFYYTAADVFCLPSTMKHEIFGIVNLEAMACGLPIIASKIGGVPDVVKDGENGLLVPPRDSEALADVIIYLLENEEVRENMGKKGRDRVKYYSWDKIAEETEKVYLNLIE